MRRLKKHNTKAKSRHLTRSTISIEGSQTNLIENELN